MADFSDIDEDNRDRESASDVAATDIPSADLQSPPSADGDSPEAKLARKKPGRKAGGGKTPGSGRIRYKVHGPRLSEEDMQAMLRSYVSPLLRRQFSIAMGEEVWAGGRTGKSFKARPSLAEQIKAAEVILSRTVPSLSATETTSTNLNVSAEPTPKEVEQLRKALYDSLTSYAAQQATPGTVENIPDKPDTMSDMSADIRDMTRLRDTPAPDASGLIHFTDPDAIKAWDAEQRAAATSPVPKSSNGRLDLGEGFFALPDIDRATGRQRFACFNSAGDLCGYKQTPEACERWFYENTIPGQLLAKAGAGGQ
jgi:hypothetical protein